MLRQIAPLIKTYSFGEYILIKDSYDNDFTTWQSVSGLKHVTDTFSMLANGNF